MRRALLISAQTYGLEGCDADVEAFGTALSRHGFGCTVRSGPDATRAGIMDAVETLIGQTRPDDSVVLYFSGHGARLARSDAVARRAAGLSPWLHFLVGWGTEDAPGFRGVLSEEVTLWQRRLAGVFRDAGAQPNVTTVLDCCHSGYLARDLRLVPRAVSTAVAQTFSTTGARDLADQAATELAGRYRDGFTDTDPEVVRLVACQPESSAYESDGRGLFTSGLVAALGRSEVSFSWARLMVAVRREVQRLAPEQRPEVEGPGSRLPFSISTDADGSLPTELVEGRLQIPAARLFGVGVGDEVELTTRPVSRRLVVALRGDAAVLDASDVSAAGPEPPRALLVGSARPRYGVRIDVEPPLGARLAEAVAAAPLLTRAAAGENPFAVVRPERGGLRVDVDGLPARVEPCGGTDGGVDDAVALVELYAHARSLVELGSAVACPLEVVLLQVHDDGTRTALPPLGARVPAGTTVSLTLTNPTDAELFAWVFDVDVSGRTVLVKGRPAGTRLGPAGDVEDTATIWARGAPLAWPADVPTIVEGAPAPRPETLVLLVGSRRQDLSGLATEGVPTREVRARDRLETSDQVEAYPLTLVVVPA